MIWLILFLLTFTTTICGIWMVISRKFAEKICNSIFENYSKKECKKYARSNVSRIIEVQFTLGTFTLSVLFLIKFLKLVDLI